MRKARRRAASREIQVIRRSLTAIVRALQRLAPLLEAAAAPQPANPAGRGRKLRLSARRRAALKLQGQYMGYLRGLKPRQQQRVKAIRANKGFRAAIGLARGLGSK